jgi:AcrR family transcriptional regulator
MKKEYRNSLRTKKMIREAFAELMEEKKTISNITVAELADRADIAKSTFYNHYEDIYAVADEMLGELIMSLDEIISAMERDRENNPFVYIKSIFSFLRENEEIYKKLADSPDAAFLIARIKRLISNRVFANVNSPYLSKNKNERSLQINFFAHACVDTMVDYFRGEIDMSFDELERLMLGILNRMM